MNDLLLKDAFLVHQYWQSACIEVLGDDFYNWQPVYEIDFQTGNPICSMYQPITGKAIRIIHDEDKGPCGMYMRKSGTRDMMEDLIDELVFTLSYDSCGTEIFKMIFRVWTHSNTNFEYMVDFISRTKQPLTVE